jgi:type III secretion protein N (ATPase)
MGEYQQGADLEADEAVARIPALREFLRQRPDELTDFRTAVAQLLSLAGDGHHG